MLIFSFTPRVQRVALAGFDDVIDGDIRPILRDEHKFLNFEFCPLRHRSDFDTMPTEPHDGLLTDR